MHTHMTLANSSKLAHLATDYHCEVDTVDEDSWYDILGRFDDANIYQTWAYDEVRCGRKNISHLLLKKNGQVVAAAQSRIVKLPVLKVGIAYVRWGPLWRHNSVGTDQETFRQVIRALRNEYAYKRGLVLRLYPVLFSDDSSCFAAILSEEGYSLLPQERPDRTVVLDVSRPLEELRKGLRPHWRRNLKVAEKNELETVENGDDASFDQFVRMYKEMVGRKRFLEPNSIGEFAQIQHRLPDRFKMRITLCCLGDETCAGLVCSAIGQTAIYLFGATSNAGLKSRGSYLLHWRLVEQLSQSGVRTYDLHGIDPMKNPGTYRFKADLCGTNGREVCFLGKYQSPGNLLSDLCVACGEGVSMIFRKMRKMVAERSGDREKRGTGGPLVAPCE